MQVQSIQNNNTSFKGEIPKSKIINRYIGQAVEMAESYKGSESRQKSLEFFNTLYSMKNDGTNRKLSIRHKYPKVAKTVGIERYEDSYIIQYGDLKKLEVPYFDVINTIIDFGKMLFGNEIVIAKPTELTAALQSQKTADTAYAIKEAVCKLYEQELNKVQKTASDDYNKAFNALLT